MTTDMKFIIAVITPSKLEDVREALSELGVNNMTVIDGRGGGRQKGHSEIYRGSEYTLDLLPRNIVIVGVDRHMVPLIFEAISGVARTGRHGDGIIASVGVDEIRKIRTGEWLGSDSSGMDLVLLRYSTVLNALEWSFPAYHEQVNKAESTQAVVDMHKSESARGNPLAPVLTGICAQKGMGCAIDLIQAYLYYTLGMVHGAVGAAALRDGVRAHMSAKQMEDATAALPKFMSQQFLAIMGMKLPEEAGHPAIPEPA
jgi:nitrogen regulatory protein PII